MDFDQKYIEISICPNRKQVFLVFSPTSSCQNILSKSIVSESLAQCVRSISVKEKKEQVYRCPNLPASSSKEATCFNLMKLWFINRRINPSNPLTRNTILLIPSFGSIWRCRLSKFWLSASYSSSSTSFKSNFIMVFVMVT